MAHNNTEIEIKFPLTATLFNRIEAKLKNNSEFINESHQVDSYYNAPHRNFLTPLYAFEYLRVREKGNESSINYKHLYPEEVEEKTHSDEYETVVEDVVAIRNILKALNFKEYLVIDKTRKTYEYKDEFEIALDKVKGLGYFIEIEAKKDLGDVEQTRKKIINLAKSLGVDTAVRNNDGYVLALMKKKGLR